MWAFGEVNTAYERARVVVLPVPYDQSLSFAPGARRGPAAIIEVSEELELYDCQLDDEPARVGIHTPPPVPQVAGDAVASHALIEEAARKHLASGKFLMALGGDHSITLPLVRAHLAERGGFGVLHVDAHDDLYPSWQGSPLSHASVMRRVRELGLPVVQVGQRAVARESLEFAKKEAIPMFPASRVAAEGLPLDEIVAALPERVYVSFDFDALDPAEMPAVGTPLAGGLGFWQAVELLRAVFAEREVVGADFVEFSPLPSLIYPQMTAAQLVYKAIGLKVRQAAW